MAIINLSEYYTDNKTKSSNPEDLVPVTDRRTVSQREPILQGLDSKYINRTPELRSQIPEVQNEEPVKTGSANTGTILGAASNFANDAIQLNSNVAQSDKEANARAGKMALSGMTAGATIGSVIPGIGTVIGAAAGAVIGGTVGLLKKAPDRKKRLSVNNENYHNRLFSMTNQTNQMAERALIQEELENQQNLTKAQMGLINLKY